MSLLGITAILGPACTGLAWEPYGITSFITVRYKNKWCHWPSVQFWSFICRAEQACFDTMRLLKEYA